MRTPEGRKPKFFHAPVRRIGFFARWGSLGCACAFLGLACFDSEGARYALLVGIDQYSPSYGASPLTSCVNDVRGFRSYLLRDSARWASSNVTVLTDGAATKAAIRSSLGALSARAASGDVVIYFHSSHGGSHGGTDTYLCTYNADYDDEEMAVDFAGFASGVTVIVVVDACYSGGLFKEAVLPTQLPPWNLAENVMRHFHSVKANSKAADIGWITACDYNQLSWSGDPYSLFVGYVLQAFLFGDRDANGEATFLELFEYAAPRATAENPYQTAQKLNDALLEATVAAASVPTSSVAEAVEATRLAWITGGAAGWIGQPLVTHDGVDAARSGAIGNRASSFLETVLTGPGTLSFWWRVSSEANYDFLRFTVNGSAPFAGLSGNSGWQHRRVTLSAGAHAVRWTYGKDYSVAKGDDCGWVDEVVWEPAGAFRVQLAVPRQWVGVALWDDVTRQWVQAETLYAPTQVTFSHLMPNRWYWIGLYSYTRKRWIYGGWTQRVR